MGIKNKVNSVVYLFRLFVAALPELMYNCVLPFIDPKSSIDFLQKILNNNDLEKDDPVLKNADITYLLPGQIGDINITGSYHLNKKSATNVLSEISCLAYLMKALDPKIVFEIGTLVGRTTRLFSLNSGEACKIFTLDLKQDQVKLKIGEEYQNKPEARKITQLCGDSRVFDFSPWYDKCDFVWVDGCHDYDVVIKDAEQALRLCKKGGCIAFHDYRHTARWSGVTRALRELQKKYSDIWHIRGTTIGILIK